MNFVLNDTVLKVIAKIENAGYKAYISGGTVRELILNQIVQSYTIVCTAPRETLKLMFKKRTGENLKKLYMTVIEEKTAFDIYYSSEKYNSVKDLCAQFDFTINAVAYNSTDGIIDYFGGLEDIKNKVIRFTNSSQTLLAEKPARMLRALRYSAQLGFEVDKETAQTIKKCSMLIKRADSNKIREEFDKILISDRPDIFFKIHELGLLHYLIPELYTCFFVPQKNKYHIYNVGEHIINAVINAPNDTVIRWAALLHDIGKPLCKSTDSNGIIHFYGHHKESVRLASEILRRYRIDPQKSKEILTLIENHDVRIEPSQVGVKRMLSRTDKELFEKLLILQEADNRAKNMKFFPDKLNRINDVRKIYQKVITESHPYKVTDLAINGRDLNKLGFRPGHEIADTLQSLLEDVFIDPNLNNREYLIQKAKQRRKKRS